MAGLDVRDETVVNFFIVFLSQSSPVSEHGMPVLRETLYDPSQEKASY